MDRSCGLSVDRQDNRIISRALSFFTDLSFLLWNPSPLRRVLWGRTLMSTTDVPVDFADQPAEDLVEAGPASSEWAETVLTVLFTATAVLFVSFVAVVTGII